MITAPASEFHTALSAPIVTFGLVEVAERKRLFDGYWIVVAELFDLSV